MTNRRWQPSKNMVIVGQFLVCFALTFVGWACWAWRTVACTEGAYLRVGSIAGLEELVAISALWWSVGAKSFAGAAGCVAGAAAGAMIGTMFS